MKGTVLNHTIRQHEHACPTPIRFWWRRLGIGARWQCTCGTIWCVRRRLAFTAMAGNGVYRTQWREEAAS